MADRFVGEIKIVAFNFAPRGYASCDGQLLPIAQNQALFSILGTTYGGDGRVNFALPDLRTKVPIHTSNTITLGQTAGEQNHTLTVQEIPAHVHQLSASNQTESQNSPVGNYLATHQSVQGYAPAGSANAVMVGNEVSNAGGSQPHNNMQPYLVLNIVIALTGVFPPRN